MSPDREPNRLPLRAGAMLLLAVAVVFIGLGWHSAASSGDSPQQDLAAAGSSTPAPSTGSPASASGAPESASSSPGSAGSTLLCVYNGGSIAGLASEVTDELKTKGFRTAPPGNISSSTITENTIFYDDNTKAEAQKVSDALGGASVDPRPESFTKCGDGIPVIVVTR